MGRTILCRGSHYYSVERIGGTEFEVYQKFELDPSNDNRPKVPSVTKFWLKLQRKAINKSELSGLVIFKLGSGREFIGSIIQNSNILMNAVDNNEILKLCKIIITIDRAVQRDITACTPPCN